MSTSEYNRKYYIANKEAIKKRKAKYYQDNKEFLNRRKNEWIEKIRSGIKTIVKSIFLKIEKPY